jgi:hypothetical protein
MGVTKLNPSIFSKVFLNSFSFLVSEFLCIVLQTDCTLLKVAALARMV